MNNKVKIILSAAIVFGLVIALVIYFKPTNEASVSVNMHPTDTTSQSAPDNQNVLITNASHPTQLASDTEQAATNASGDNELVDTKSDMSIQPIDPETDIGNQIIQSN
ncbi:hypothetical protein [Acinetobacter sp. NIPH 2699]|uniref:hypothetical protein n=1 Tax=Acinetobacter sp. NIPH 2699 TaxID=2923433 RepID=UPI001F4B27B5|nr:hypothetical protein [Acinetobacter sp. NIPH 2699]MCH7336580.1 hypothetical protein [Acinetobacter sp. NIPH 2699]